MLALAAYPVHRSQDHLLGRDVEGQCARLDGGACVLHREAANRRRSTVRPFRLGGSARARVSYQRRSARAGEDDNRATVGTPRREIGLLFGIMLHPAPPTRPPPAT